MSAEDAMAVPDRKITKVILCHYEIHEQIMTMLRRRLIRPELITPQSWGKIVDHYSQMEMLASSYRPGLLKTLYAQRDELNELLPSDLKV